MTHFNVLIVGAGHAGSQVAITLRQLKFEGSIGVLGDEVELPYERPPLSKDYLQGEKDFDRIMIRPAQFWEDQHIQMLTGRRVTQVLPTEHAVLTESGERYSYDQLVWATGGTPRRLAGPGSELEGVHYIRKREDIDRILSELPHVQRIVVIGGGYIGLEAAASLRKMGKEVVLLESLDRVLARVACETLSRFIEAEHRSHGVDVRLSVVVKQLEATGGRVGGVTLSDGSRIQADLVIVGIGIVPEVQVLLDAGAEGANGVEVDRQCRTSLPDVFAIGDCSCHPNRFADNAKVRLESVQNAVDQANVVAKILMNQEAHYESLPWFWSNQYDLKLQTAGLALGYDETRVRGDLATRSFSIEYFKENRLIAVDCVNAPRDYVAARKKLTEQFVTGAPLDI
ncbi:NAD(P)/FAD-dependent oxidoreductase [Pseudomonas citronellolis]|uniref:NAD(P)/FAD-dependent oxidoreductase n=1 Tax=Pseudomonas citronellolis TaxID=53408 RepID=UPI0009F5F7AE|nr:FAD/NAD(P)-binding oxidoreductase [Pseudomonas humi]